MQSLLEQRDVKAKIVEETYFNNVAAGRAELRKLKKNKLKGVFLLYKVKDSGEKTLINAHKLL